MRVVTVLMFINLLSGYLIAQDWQPFVLGKTYYDVQYVENDVKVESFVLDTISGTDTEQWALFSPVFCDDAELFFNRPVLYSNFFGMINEDKIEAQFINQDGSISYSGPWNDNLDTEWGFTFKPSLNPGQTFQNESVEIKCVSKSEMQILDNLDSIKTFICSTPPFDSVTFILSKNHGFVQFPPLRIFSDKSNATSPWSYFYLIGTKTSELTIGYVQPDFNDYFHLHAGDLLYWHSSSFDPSKGYEIQYYMDSIHNSYISLDSVAYEFNRKIFGHNGQFIEQFEDSVYYLRSKEGGLLAAALSWPHPGDTSGKQAHQVHFVQALELDVNGSDTITNFRSEISGLEYDGCSIDYLTDQDFIGHYYSTYTGLTKFEHHSWGSSFTIEIIGSVINGTPLGIVEIPTSIVSLSATTTNAYPNPVTQTLTLDVDAAVIRPFELHDLHGRLLMHGYFDGSIDLSSLNSGIYFIRLLDQNHLPISQVRVIKE